MSLLPLRRAGEDPRRFWSRLRTEYGVLLRDGAQLCFPNSRDPLHSNRRQVQLAMDDESAPGVACTYRLVDARHPTATDRTLYGIHGLRTDLVREPGGPAFGVSEERDGRLILHLAPDSLVGATPKAGRVIRIGTVNGGWEIVGEDLFHPEVGAVQGQIVPAAPSKTRNPN